MNYYNRHIGDYAKQTAHLSFAEDGAYNRMLDYYYASEQPLPLDREVLYRKVRARSKPERVIVDQVLIEFFHEKSDGWHKNRCDEEIEKYQLKAEKNRENGTHGGRPKKPNENPNNNPKITQSVSKDNPNETLARSQKPVAKNQEKNSATADAVDNSKATLRGAMAAALRAEGVTITPSNPLLVQWIERGVTVQTAREAVDIARERKPKPEKIPPAYLDPIVAELLGGGQKTVSKVNGTPPGEWWQSIDGIRKKADELGVKIENEDLDGKIRRCAIAAKLGPGPWLDQRNFTEMRIYEQMLQQETT